MKHNFWLLPVLLTGLAFTRAFAAPVSATATTSSPTTIPPEVAATMTPPSSAIPPEVAATMTPGAKSLHLQEFPLSGHRVLVHLWTPVRSGPIDPQGAKPEASPIFLDLFKPGVWPGKWVLANTAIYLSNDEPPADLPIQHVTVRWLRPAKKEGLVVVVSSGSPDMTLMKLITFSEGVAATPIFGAVNEFIVGDTGPSVVSQKFGLDNTGTMTVETTETEPPRGNNDNQGRVTTVVNHWNGLNFVPVGS